jgi:thioesterase domain-containing protein
MREMNKNLLEDYLHKHIPISSAMGITVDKASSSHIILKAPFTNNINHKQTVFGGSLHAVATLACWSLLHLNVAEIMEDNYQIVIASSEIKYIAPVASDFKAECKIPEAAIWDKFIHMLRKKGKSRMHLNAQIHQANQLCVAYSGVFVALKTT